MRTGEVEANLLTLNDAAGLGFIPDLVARKVAGPEHSVLDDADVHFTNASTKTYGLNCKVLSRRVRCRIYRTNRRQRV